MPQLPPDHPGRGRALPLLQRHLRNRAPQQAAEFAAQTRNKQALLAHRRVGVVLLIFAVIPCTAPLAAVFGVIWYLVAHRHIAAMPPLQATICRLAVGIALGITVLLIVLAVIYAAFHPATGA